MGEGRALSSDDASYVRRHAGRLVELRIQRIACVREAEALQADLATAMKLAGDETVIFADYRTARPMLPEVATVWSRAMRQNNRRVVRGGLLLDPANEILNLQIERIVRCATNPNRRLFTDADALRGWVDVACKEDDRKALAELFPRP